MRRRAAVRKYHYWSTRKVEQLATDNDISIDRRSWLLRSPGLPLLPQGEVSSQSRDLRRHELAKKVELALGSIVVEDFAIPPPVRFARGSGHIEFARFWGERTANDGSVMYTDVLACTDQRVHVCLFGSMDNFTGQLRRAPFERDGWTSSADFAIRELLGSGGRSNTSQWDDDEQRAVEAHKIATTQGITDSVDTHEGKPWTRGYTFGSLDGAEWLAEVYIDVEIDPERWRDDIAGDRVLVGSPIWIRTPPGQPVALYHPRRLIRRRSSVGKADAGG